jgi:hypothetical protein
VLGDGLARLVAFADARPSGASSAALLNTDGTLQRSVRGVPDARGGSRPSTSSCASSRRARTR